MTQFEHEKMILLDWGDYFSSVGERVRSETDPQEVRRCMRDSFKRQPWTHWTDGMGCPPRKIPKAVMGEWKFREIALQIEKLLNTEMREKIEYSLGPVAIELIRSVAGKRKGGTQPLSAGIVGAPASPIAIDPAKLKDILSRVLAYTLKNAAIPRIETRPPNLPRDADLYVARGVEPEFRQFLASPDSSLFVIAEPAGAGATTFAKRISRSMHEADGHCVLFLTDSDFAAHRAARPDVFLETVLLSKVAEQGGLEPVRELLQHLEFDQADLDKLELRDGTIAGLTETLCFKFWPQINKVVSQGRPFVIVLDGVGKSVGRDLDDGWRVLEPGLQRAVSHPAVKILLTCRHTAWVGTSDEGLQRLVEVEGIRDKFYRSAGAGIGSCALSGPDGARETLLGHFSEAEFIDAWDRYTKIYNVDGYPVGEASQQLRQPLLLKLYCEARQSQPVGELRDVRVIDVLAQYGLIKRNEIAGHLLKSLGQRPEPMRKEILETGEQVRGSILAIAGHMFNHETRRLDRSQAIECVLSSFDPAAWPKCLQPTDALPGSELAEAMVDQFVNCGLLAIRGGPYEFNLDSYYEYCLGRYLVHSKGRSGNQLLNRLIARYEAEPELVSAVMKFAILDAEFLAADGDDRYLELIRYLVSEAPIRLQDAALEVIGDLVVVRFPSNPRWMDNEVGSRLRKRLPIIEHDSRPESMDQKSRQRFEELRKILDTVRRARVGGGPSSKLQLFRAIRALTGVDTAHDRPGLLPELERWCQEGSQELCSAVALEILAWRRPNAALKLMRPAMPLGVIRSITEPMVDVGVRDLSRPHASGLSELPGAIDALLEEDLSPLSRGYLQGARVRAALALDQSPTMEMLAPARADNPDWGSVTVLFALVDTWNDWIALAEDAPATWRELPNLVRSLDLPRRCEGWTSSGNVTERWTAPALAAALTAGVRDSALILSDDIFDHDYPGEGPENARLGIVFHPELLAPPAYARHDAPERVVAVLSAVGETSEPARYYSCKRARDADVLLVHTKAEIDLVRRSGTSTEDALRRWSRRRADELRPGSYEAACRSAGSATRAIELAARGAHEVVLSANRPPGHSANNRISIVDNIAIGVVALLAQGAEDRVFVLDLDAHHGAHLERSLAKRSEVRYASIHEAGVHADGAARPDATSIRIALPTGSRSDALVEAVRTQVLPAIKKHAPTVLVIACGGDGDLRDGLSGLAYEPDAFHCVGQELASGEYSTAICLEGGYDIEGGLPETVGRLVAGLLSRRSGC